MKRITVFLVAATLLADFAFASYNVGVLDVYSKESTTSKMLVSLSESLSSTKIKSVVMDKDDLHGKNGKLFAMCDCIVVRGDADLSKEDIIALHSFAVGGKELIFLGKVMVNCIKRGVDYRDFEASFNRLEARVTEIV